ncbi:MAG TPA: hypothetical protein VK453_00940 [Micromonosporaceae bacterium]|nr:hypothetical protein [Micromonosporaceae bacterium]
MTVGEVDGVAGGGEDAAGGVARLTAGAGAAWAAMLPRRSGTADGGAGAAVATAAAATNRAVPASPVARTVSPAIRTTASTARRSTSHTTAPTDLG